MKRRRRDATDSQVQSRRENLRDMSSSSSSEEDDKFYWDGRAKDSDAYLGEDVFKVEAIRRRRIREGETEYLIKWMGWDS